MKRNFLIISLWLGLASGAALAQEADESAETESTVESKDEAVEADTKEPPPADDVFVPSERISADQEVIFPVDI